MKSKFLCILVVVFVLGSCNFNSAELAGELLATVVGNNGEAVEIRKGITWEQVAEAGAKSDTFAPILCMRDLQGRVVVAYAKDPKPLDRVYVFAARDTLPTRAECEEITAGMPMAEVIERLGVPTQYPKASLVTYYWQTQEGVDVIARYDENFVVTSVEFITSSAELAGELLATVVGNNGEAVEIRKGITWEQVAEAGAKSDTFAPILCMRDLQGQVVVAYAKDPKPLDHVYVFGARDILPTRAECEEITAGMPMAEVIKRLGVPGQYPKTSLVTYYWKTQEGVDVIARYDENFVVTSVEFIDPSAES